MPTETFKTNYGNVPKLTELNYPISRDKVRRVLMGVDAYAIVTREEPEPEGTSAAIRTEQLNWRTRRNDAQVIIYMGCSDEILSHIKNIVDPAEMWGTLNDRFDRTILKLGHTQILRNFQACRPAKDKKMDTTSHA
jgi:hypothetical protein